MLDISHPLIRVLQVAFYMHVRKEPKEVWTKFKVKALVTDTHLPGQDASDAPQIPVVMWIGVGYDVNESLLRLSNNPVEPGPEELTSEHWLHATGEVAASDDKVGPGFK